MVDQSEKRGFPDEPPIMPPRYTPSTPTTTATIVDKSYFALVQDFYYLVSAFWTETNGEIDNRNLFENNIELRSDLERIIDYYLVGESDWKELVQTNGIVNSTHEIKVKVSDGQLELYELCVIYDDTETLMKFPTLSYLEVYSKICRKFELQTPILKFEETVLDDASIIRNKGTINVQKSELEHKRSRIQSHLNTYNSSNTDLEPKFTLPCGATGLNNLGNTCFMNSSLQCLSNCIPLTTYFLNDSWQNDLNTNNPMGLNGRVAQHYASLVSQIWESGDSRRSSVYPSEFKSTIGDFNSMFSSYYQQDSQELLGSLLDGLHEDLNRIKKKPYIEMPDMVGQPDTVIADKMWEVYRQRNDSVIVDYIQGEYRSKVECLTCGETTLKFDPYMFLALPIPQDSLQTIKIFAAPMAPGVKPFHLGVKIARNSTILQLQTKLKELLGWSECVIVEIFSGKIYKSHRTAEIFEFPSADLIYAYEADGSPQQVGIPVYFSRANRTLTMHPEVFGVPLFANLPSLISYRSNDTEKARSFGNGLYQQLVNGIIGYAKVGLFSRDGQVCQAGFIPDMDNHDGWEVIPNLFRIAIASEKTSLSTYHTTNGDAFYQNGWRGYNANTVFVYPFAVPKVEKEEQPDTANNSNTGLNPNLIDTDAPPPIYDLIDSPTELDVIRANPIVELSEETVDLTGKVLIIMEWEQASADRVFGLDKASLDVERPLISNPNYTESFKADENREYIAFLASERELRSKERSKSLSLESCFEEFIKEEIMGAEEAFYCSRCKLHQTIKKKIDIWSVPDILVFVLKRFQNSVQSSFRSLGSSKIDTMVNFPISGLELGNAVVGNRMDPGDLVYDLFAVSNHIGGTGGGHYTAYAKNGIDGNWYLFDDSNVRQVSETDVMSREAYILFYQKRGPEIKLEEAIKERRERGKGLAATEKSYGVSSSSSFIGPRISRTSSGSTLISNQAGEEEGLPTADAFSHSFDSERAKPSLSGYLHSEVDAMEIPISIKRKDEIVEDIDMFSEQ